VLDLWPYKVGLKERVAAIEKELQASQPLGCVHLLVIAGR
jgi:hypothetical protein